MAMTGAAGLSAPTPEPKKRAIPKLKYDCREGESGYNDKSLKYPERVSAIRRYTRTMERIIKQNISEKINFNNRKGPNRPFCLTTQISQFSCIRQK